MSRNRRRIVMVGSSTFPISPEIGAEVVDLMRAYPEGTVILTRGTGVFDVFVATVGPAIGYPVLTYPSPGGSKNWDRDIAMVKDADEVLCFLDPNTLQDQNTGTAHVLAKGLDQKKPCRAYSVADRHLVYAGSTE